MYITLVKKRNKFAKITEIRGSEKIAPKSYEQFRVIPVATSWSSFNRFCLFAIILVDICV